MKSLAASLSLLALAGLAPADIRSDLDATNRKLDRAMKAKDLKAVEALMRASVTPEFKYIEAGKPQNFKTFIANLNGSLAMMTKIDSVSSRIYQIKQVGDRATATVEHSIAGKMKNPDGKTHATRWTGMFTESYRLVDGKWKTYQIKPTSQKFLLDGKPVKL